MGRYRRGGELKIKLSGDFLGEHQQFVFQDKLPKQTRSGRNVFVQRLWATRRIGQIIDEIDLYGENEELVDELIVLSKRHGILTPYTAYLAEERTDLNDLRAGRRIAQSHLQSLKEDSGADAFFQRDFKSRLRRAARPSDISERMEMQMQSASAGGATPAAGGSLGGRRRVGFGVPGEKGANTHRARGELTATGTERVKQIGAKTFFLRANRYVDSDATKEQIAAAIKFEQFSDEYFELLIDLDEESKVYLAEESEVLVVLNGKTYLITPPKPEQ